MTTIRQTMMPATERGICRIMKGYVLKHETPTRIFHWVNLIVFLLLLCSGLAIFSPKLHFLAVIFGGLKNAAAVHRYLGYAYIVVPLIYIVLNFGLFKRFLSTITHYTADDLQWLKVGGGYLQPFLKGEVPPQDKYNAGQKMLGLMVIFFSCLLAASGLVMIYYQNVSPALVRWAYLLHSFSGIFLGCGVIVHGYLAAVNPSSSKELKTMLGSGYIEEDFAKHHNSKWYQQVAAKK
ncbi:MAG: formate dehydrogenase, gamma subunit [Firmicutes bacterium]|nr:formate dehydrogenase, gamma subunit [Bacillota bacterium]